MNILELQRLRFVQLSGTWVSPYDGATWTAASDVDIDHLVRYRLLSQQLAFCSLLWE